MSRKDMGHIDNEWEYHQDQRDLAAGYGAVGCLAIAIVLMAVLAYAIVPVLCMVIDKVCGTLLCWLFMAFG